MRGSGRFFADLSITIETPNALRSILTLSCGQLIGALQFLSPSGPVNKQPKDKRSKVPFDIKKVISDRCRQAGRSNDRGVYAIDTPAGIAAKRWLCMRRLQFEWSQNSFYSLITVVEFPSTKAVPQVSTSALYR